MAEITLTVNGRRVRKSVEPRLSLADFLRERLRLTGLHLGCEHGVCGACTVLKDEVPVRACLQLAVACDGAEIRTIEGLDDDADAARLRDAFSRNHALQCGYCTPGMMIMARDVVRRLDSPDEARIRREMSGNLCRCTGYQGIVDAILETVGGNGKAGSPDGAPGQGGDPNTGASDFTEFEKRGGSQ